MGIEADVARDAVLDDLAKGDHQLARLVQADEAGERLLQDLVLAEPQEFGDRLVREKDLALEVGNEDGIRGVGDDQVGVQMVHRLLVPGPLRAPVEGGLASTASPSLRPNRSIARPKRRPVPARPSRLTRRTPAPLGREAVFRSR